MNQHEHPLRQCFSELYSDDITSCLEGFIELLEEYIEESPKGDDLEHLKGSIADFAHMVHSMVQNAGENNNDR